MKCKASDFEGLPFRLFCGDLKTKVLYWPLENKGAPGSLSVFLPKIQSHVWPQFELCCDVNDLFKLASRSLRFFLPLLLVNFPGTKDLLLKL